MYVRKQRDHLNHIKRAINQMFSARSEHADNWYKNDTKEVFEAKLWEAIYPKNYQVILNKLPRSYFPTISDLTVKIIHLENKGDHTAGVKTLPPTSSLSRGMLANKAAYYSVYRLDISNSPYSNYNLPAIFQNQRRSIMTDKELKDEDWREEIPPLVAYNLYLGSVATDRMIAQTVVNAEHSDFLNKVEAIYDSVPSLNRFCKEWPPGRDLLPPDVLREIDRKRGKIDRQETDLGALNDLHAMYVKAKVAQ